MENVFLNVSAGVEIDCEKDSYQGEAGKVLIIVCHVRRRPPGQPTDVKWSKYKQRLGEFIISNSNRYVSEGWMFSIKL